MADTQKHIVDAAVRWVAAEHAFAAELAHPSKEGERKRVDIMTALSTARTKLIQAVQEHQRALLDT